MKSMQGRGLVGVCLLVVALLVLVGDWLFTAGLCLAVLVGLLVVLRRLCRRWGARTVAFSALAVAVAVPFFMPVLVNMAFLGGGLALARYMARRRRGGLRLSGTRRGTIQVGRTRGRYDSRGTFVSEKDGLPTYPASDARIGDGVKEVRALRHQLREEDATMADEVAAGRRAIDTLRRLGPFADAALDNADLDDRYLVGRMGDAGTAEGLENDDRGAFWAWGAISPSARKTVADQVRAGT